MDSTPNKTMAETGADRAGQMLPNKRTPRGAALAEMGMIVGLISVLTIGAVMTVGEDTEEIFCIAAGTLNKINGGDGFCQGEFTAVDSVIDGPIFEDMTWKPEISGEVFVKAELTAPLPYPARLTMSPGVFSVEACYLDEALDAPALSCGGPSGAGGTSEVTVPQGASTYGYRLTLPADPETYVSDVMHVTFDEEVENGRSLEWDINLLRVSNDPPFAPTLEFSDITFPVGTTGRQEIMVPLTGIFSEEMLFSAEPAGRLTYGACAQQTPATGVACASPINALSSAGVSFDDYAVGYVVDLPANTGEAVDEMLDLALDMPGWVSNSVDWSIRVRRSGDGTPAIVPEMAFADVVAPAGSESQVINMAAQSGQFTGNMLFSVDGLGVLPVGACYAKSSGIQCNGASLTPNSKGPFGPSGWNSIGYRLQLPDATEEVDTYFELTASSVDSPEVTHTWKIGVTRPAVAASITNNLSFYDWNLGPSVDFTRKQVPALDQSQMQGDFTFTVDGGTIPVGICWKVAGIIADQECATAVAGESVKTFTGQLDTLGIHMTTPADASRFEAYAGTIHVELASVSNPDMKQSWDIAVTREAETPTIDETLAFNDISVGAGGSLTGTRYVLVDRSLMTGNYTLTTKGTAAVEVAPCIGYYDETKYAVCGTLTTGEASAAAITDKHQLLGFTYKLVNNDVWVDTEEPFEITVTSDNDPSVTKTWTPKLIRPAKVASIDIAAPVSFADVKFGYNAAISRTVLVELDKGAAVGDYILSTNGHGAMSVAPCTKFGTFGTACETPGSDIVSRTSMPFASNYQIGFQITQPVDTPQEAYAGSFDLVMTSVQNPSLSKTWTIQVSRPERTQEFMFDATLPEEITIAAGQGVTADYLYNHGLTTAYDVYISTNGGGVINMRPCLLRGYTGQACGAYSTGQGAEFDARRDQYLARIGFSLKIPAGNTEIDQVVTFTARNTANPSESHTRNIRILRPAVSAE